MTFQYPAVSRRNLMKSVAAAGLLANFSITPLSQAVAAAMDIWKPFAGLRALSIAAAAAR